MGSCSMNCRRAVGLAVASCVIATTAVAGVPDFRVLVFSKTVGFRHGSISDGIALIQLQGMANNFAVDLTEDASDFTAANLSQYAVVVWLSTTGNVLDDTQQAEFEAYLQAGGGYVGVHAAADCEYNWPWYGQLLGNDAWFRSHPSIQDATLDVEDATHISTAHLPASFTFRDEWYNFRNNPRPAVNVLLTIDETSYNPGNNAMGADHPIAWNHDYDGGRVWYTALGHRSQTFADSDFQTHLLGGIRWAAGCDTLTGPCNAPALPGDMNCDGVVSVSDIGPFVVALTDPAQYAIDFPDCDILNADLNGDGFVTVGDIGGFVALLTGA